MSECDEECTCDQAKERRKVLIVDDASSLLLLGGFDQAPQIPASAEGVEEVSRKRDKRVARLQRLRDRRRGRILKHGENE